MKQLTPPRFRIAVLSLSALALFGCPPPTPPTPPPPAADAGCVDWRWVAVKDPAEAACPDPGGDWRREPLFAGASTPPLVDYCLYRHPDPDLADPQDVLDLVGSTGPLTSASRDCMVVQPAGPLTDATCDEFHAEFLDRVGDHDLQIEDGQPSVRLALLDTLPTFDEGSPKDQDTNSLHGTSLAYLAEELVCDGDDDCAAQVTSRLAMSCTGLDADQKCENDDDLGGYFGMISELAAAIYAEVDAWKAQVTNHPTHLILNLSLGWDPDIEAPDAEDAVRDAIEEAVCSRALVIAAAGNPTAGTEATGPLLPAGWETLPVPPACAAGSGSDYEPLVHAVGGLRFDGRRLALSRPGSLPRLAAFADHWAAATPPESPTAALTGTSVAAMVVSATAAAVWHLQPGLGPYEIIQRVYDSGTPVAGLGSEFQLDQESHDVRRVSLCRAVTESCPGPGCPCPSPGQSLLDVSEAANLDFDVDGDPKPQVLTADFESQGANGNCSASEIHVQQEAQPPDPYYPCPFEQLPGLQPVAYTGPQPGDDACPTCGMFPDGDGGFAESNTYTLLIEIADDFAGTLSSPTLTIGSSSYSLGLADMTQGDRAVIEKIGIDSLGPDDRLDLTWAVMIDGEPIGSVISYPAMMTTPPPEPNWKLP